MRPPRLVAFAFGALLGSAAVAQDRAASRRAGTSSEPILLAASLPSDGVEDLALAGAPMMPSHAPVLGALPTQATHDAAVAGLLPRPEDLAAVLPAPPQKVKLENSYGTVTVTHAAHLARRIACKSCHGPGPIQKIGRFQPREAHETCRACHVKVARGPTDCRGCHVKNVEPAPVTASAAPEPPPKKEPVAFAYVLPGAQPAAFDPTVASAAFETAASWSATGAGPVPAGAVPAGAMAAPDAVAQLAPLPVRRRVFTGVSMLAATGASPAAGVSLGVTFEQNGFRFSDILEWAGGSGSRRALGLLAAGPVFPIRDRWTAHVLGVGGFDAADVKWTSFNPALGARGGIEFATRRAYVQSIDLSVTALADVTRSRDPRGSSTSGALVSVSLSMATDLTGRR